MTPDLLKQLCPAIKDPISWSDSLNKYLPSDFTNQDNAMFIAQVSHESLDFNALEENLNYSADRLMQVFPRYFRGVDVNRYARTPRAIGSRVYANRMGNGDEASGDGYKYRGRGLIMITGKYNYSDLSKFLFNDDTLIDDPDQLLTNDLAVQSALWFWGQMNLQGNTDIQYVTRKINGGLNGLDDRQRRYDRALRILA